MSQREDGSNSAGDEMPEVQAVRKISESNIFNSRLVNPVHFVQKLNLFSSNHSGVMKADEAEAPQLSSVDSDDNAIEDAEDSAVKLLNYVETNLKTVSNILEFPQIVKRIFGIFLRERPPKDGEARDEAL